MLLRAGRRRSRCRAPGSPGPCTVAIRVQQRDVAAHLLVGRIHIAEDLRARGVGQLLVAVDVDQRTLLLALVTVEDAQRNARRSAPASGCASGLLFDEFQVYQALKVGSVEPLAMASLWLVLDCSMVSMAARRSGRASSAACSKSVERLQSRSEKSNGPMTSN